MATSTIGMYAQHLLYWLFFNAGYQRKYNKKWDIQLSQMIDDVESGEEFARLGVCVVVFSKADVKREVWIENKQYAYAYLYSENGTDIPEYLQFRPSIHTMIRLSKLVDKLESGKDNLHNLTEQDIYG